MSTCRESGFRLPAMEGATERAPPDQRLISITAGAPHAQSGTAGDSGRRSRAIRVMSRRLLFEFGMVAHAPGSKQPAQRVNPVFAIPFYGFRPLKGLVKTRKPGALGLGFNWNFPLAYGHSSRTLRSKIPASPSG
jgi:hypothetical protein